MKKLTTSFCIIAAVLGAACATQSADTPSAPRKEYRVPYRLAQSNLTTVRAKINGKGPFNFLIDSGAPALIVFKECADLIGLKPGASLWANVNKVEVEGGVVVERIQARIDDPARFPLPGMSKPELLRMRLGGIMGYDFLARFQIQLDYTRPFMVWTKLDYEPPPPATRLRAMTANPALPADSQEPQPTPTSVRLPRPPPDLRAVMTGFLGMEVDATEKGVRVTNVYKGGPAEAAGLKTGDVIVEFGSQPIRSAVDWVKRPLVQEGAAVALKIQRGKQTISVTIKSTNGL